MYAVLQIQSKIIPDPDPTPKQTIKLDNQTKHKFKSFKQKKVVLHQCHIFGSRAGNSLIPSFRSNQMSICERFAQIAQDK